MDPMQAALQYLNSLKPGEKPQYNKTAAKYGVERSTLARRHQGLSTSRSIRDSGQRALHPQQEKELVSYINRLTRLGLPPTKSRIRNFGSQIAKRELSIHWAGRFIKRHHDDLIVRWATGIDRLRHQADSAAKYKLYFKLLDNKIQQYKIEPRNMYNMDEKGFLLGVVTRSKRVFSRRLYEEGKLRSLIQDGSREWITLLACICADGSFLEPALIYKSTSGSIQDSWLQAFDPEDHQARFASSPTGWTNNDIGLAWLKQVFDRNTKAKARSSYRLLILNSHGSHVTIDFIEYCNQNKILLAIYPPHSTHTLQPLDVCMFKPLSTAYSNGISRFMERCQGLTSMSKRDFFALFIAAWEASFKESTILKAFQATGLSPFNPDAILQRFNSRQPISGTLSDSDSSALSASNWRKTEGLLREVVKDRGDPRAQKLSQAFHSISVQKTLLEQETKGLREALLNEKLRRKRGKALPLEQPEEYHGGAIFWSPRKIKEARDRQRQQELKEKQQQLQKLEATRLREQEKQAKTKAVEARRQAKAEARLLREKQKTEKAADQASRQAARKAAKRLKQALKTSQKRDKSTLKAPAKATSRKKLAQKPASSREPQGALAGAPSIQSRRGRIINLPAKYK